MFATLLVLAHLQQPETAQHAYDELQRRLRGAKSIKVVTVPTTGNSWDRETFFYFERPNKARISGWGMYYATDGKRTSSNDPEFNRPYKKGDELILPAGFEANGSKPSRFKPVGNLQEVTWGSRVILAIDLEYPDGGVSSLFLDKETRLPAGWGNVRGAAADPQSFVNPTCAVTLDPPREGLRFDVVAPTAAAPIVASRAWLLRRAKTISLTIQDRTAAHGGRLRAFITADKNGAYQRTMKSLREIWDDATYANGRWVITKSGSGESRSKRPKPTLPPGFEPFWGATTRGKMSRFTQPTWCNGYECHAVTYIEKNVRTDVFYMADPNWKTYLKTGILGYQRRRDGVVVEKAEYDNVGLQLR